MESLAFLSPNKIDLVLTNHHLFPRENMLGAWQALSESQRHALCWWCVTAFREHPIRGRRIPKHITSYSLKHRFEESKGAFYVSNGQFKIAMLVCDFFPKDSRDLNWSYPRLWYSDSWNMGRLGDIPRFSGVVPS